MPNRETSYRMDEMMDVEQRDPDEVIATCAEAIRLSPQDAKAHYNRGIAWDKRKGSEKLLPTGPEQFRSTQKTPARTMLEALPGSEMANRGRRFPTTVKR